MGDIPLTVIALDHFISLSARNWPVGAVARLWDLIILDGTPALMSSFLALLELYLSPAIEEAKQSAAFDPALVMQCFKQLSTAGVTQNIDLLLEHTRKFQKQIPKELLQQLREEISCDRSSF